MSRNAASERYTTKIGMQKYQVDNEDGVICETHCSADSRTDVSGSNDLIAMRNFVKGISTLPGCCPCGLPTLCIRIALNLEYTDSPDMILPAERTTVYRSNARFHVKPERLSLRTDVVQLTQVHPLLAIT